VRAICVLTLAALLASCASSGFYQMSDDWCAAHPKASHKRCFDHVDT
jgi:hypothetical protein